MKFYRVRITVDRGISGGFEWFTNKRAAEARARDYPEEEEPYTVDTITITPTKTGILTALNLYADHPDNG